MYSTYTGWWLEAEIVECRRHEVGHGELNKHDTVLREGLVLLLVCAVEFSKWRGIWLMHMKALCILTKERSRAYACSDNQVPQYLMTL